MDFKTFLELSKSYNKIPVYEIITADLLTPVLAYLKIREKIQIVFYSNRSKESGGWQDILSLAKAQQKFL
jgi:hypothetical protein